MNAAKKREAWPDGYSEPEWLWKLEQNWPRPSSMFHVGLYGAAIAFALFGFIRFRSELAFSISASCFVLGCMFAGSKNPSDISVSDRPEVMLHKWLQQKARADAWAGMPWSDERKQILRDCVKWGENNAQNDADDKEAERAKSLLSRIAFKSCGTPLRPKPSISNTITYQSMLIDYIEQAENQLKLRGQSYPTCQSNG